MKELLLQRFKNEGMKELKNERILSIFNRSILLLLFFFTFSNSLKAGNEKFGKSYEFLIPSVFNSFVPTKDTIPLRERSGDYLRDSVRNSFDLRDPSIIEKNIEFDPVTYKYYVTEKIGTEYYRTPTVLTFDEYVKYKNKQQEAEYFERLSGLSKKRKTDLVDPLSKVDFSATQNNKLQMLIKSVGVNGKLPQIPKLDAKKMGDNLIGLIFGDPPTVDIRPQGQIDLTLGGDYRYYGNPTIPTFARTTGGLLFNMDIQMRVTGKIGNKLNLNTAFNNKAQFDFDNIMKLNYNTNVFGDDDIIKAIEAGNVNLPLRGTLIQGSQNLFGIKTELQFGYLRLTAIAAQQRNRKQNIQVQGGSTLQNFSVNIDQYDENRHFFLSHFNRGTYEKALKNLPLINSLFTVTRMEVWVSNDRNEDREIRQIVALSDLGETSRFNNKNTRVNPGSPRSIEGALPDNDANDVYKNVTADKSTRRIDKVIRNLEGTYGFVQGLDYVKRSAKRLQANEYTFNPKLGTISINNIDRQQVMGVSFTYFYNGQGPYQVGEFAENIPTVTGSDSVSQVVFCKLLKNNTNNPNIPLFDLMMKNVYSINAFVNSPQDLKLDIYYQDAGTTGDAGKDKAEKRSLSEIPGIPLLRLLNLDRLNQSGDPQPDGLFDFVPDVTINTKTGRIYFPLLEPFGKSLRSKLALAGALSGIDSTSLGDRYAYDSLYTTTLFQAQQNQSKNRFLIKGQVKSTSSNKIQLQAFGLKPGAVTVTAGGIKLLEGVDFAIDYGTALLTVLNPAYVSPNINLNVAIEDNSLFNFQTRTMLGLRADYAYKKNFNIGATYMNLFEIPYLRKVNFGDDPINNKVFGLDLNFTEDAPWLTRLVDKLPFIQTKEASKITFAAETAVMKPGHAGAIDGQNTPNQGGVVYLDDFEGSSSPFSLTSQTNAWSISSVPQKHPLWREANDTTIVSGANRALLNWYRIDNYLQTTDQSLNPGDDYTASIQQGEVFPNKSSNVVLGLGTGGAGGYPLYTFDLSYYPKERGPYNFDEPDGLLGYTKGLSNTGGLNAPETRWAGIQRGMTTTDFEAANIEYMDFWMLDPFRSPDGKSQDNAGKLIIHLGEISEDILKDGRKTYENGLPSPSNPNLRTDPSIWGRVPRTEIPLPNSFSADDADRIAQDIGLDGLNNDDERSFKQQWLSKIQSRLTTDAYQKILADPSNDDFVYYNDESYKTNQTTILQKYRKFNGQEGNSKASSGQNVQSATNIPDAEDVNRDNSFDENEAYYEYEIPLNPLPTAGNDTASENMDSKNLKYYIEQIKDGAGSGRRWYHLRVPISDYAKKYGQVNDFRNIRFMRLIVKGFSKETHIRFAKFDLIRNQWRKSQNSLTVDGITTAPTNTGSSLELSAINIEENGAKKPFNYVVPPGIVRDNIVGSTGTNALQNEQALNMKFTNLANKEGRGAFKLFASDLRIYDRMKMFVHAESIEQSFSSTELDGKMCAFMRLGSDFETNYYEYEIPLTLTKEKGLPTNLNINNGNGIGVNPYADSIWNAANSFDFALQGLIAAKKLRNAKNFPLNEVFVYIDPENPLHKIKIKGNPDLGLVKGVMIGAYNKSGDRRQLELWVNELRCTGLNEHAGAAALARLDVKLADLANVSISGNYLGIGYGAIDQRVLQRSRERVIEYNVIGNFEMGKFINPKLGIHVPMTVQFGNKTTTPEYDPYDLDVKLADKLLDTPDPAVRDSINRTAQTVQTINAISFNNVRKDRTSDKAPRPWNIENFSVSYAKTNLERHDPVVESEKRESTKGSLDYTFSMEPLYISPFKKLIKNEKVGKYLKFVTDFHFNPLPNNFGFNTVLDRQFNTLQYRFAGEEASTNTFYQRRFTWDRNYTLQWDLTRSLKLNFDAKNNAIIDELSDFDASGFATDPEAKSQFLSQNLRNFGRTKRYDQNINVNYTVPTKNIPFLEWITLRGTYGATYGWEAFSYNPSPGGDPENFKAIGNNINNRQNRQVNADLNFDNLYNTSKYLKKIQVPLFTDAPKVKKKKGVKGQDAGVGKDAQNPTDSLQNSNGKGQLANSKAKKAKLPKEYEPSVAEKIVIRPLLALRKARFNYTEQINSFVPGFVGDPRGNGQAGLFGMQNLSSPGWDYVLGAQEADLTWLEKARRNNWISTDIRQVKAALLNKTQTFDARLTVEPFTDFKVDIDLNSNKVENQSLEYRNTSAVNNIDSIQAKNFYQSGSYTVSFLALNTFFRDPEEVFNAFDANRPQVSNSLNPTGAPHPEYPGYKLGYGPTNQQVLIKSFMAAYLGKDAKSYDVNANLTNQLPRFNWRLSYNGLAKLPGLKDIFTSINITHGYKSTLTVNSFNSDQNYDAQNAAKPQRESPNEYYSQYNIPTVVISEQFQPLLGIDVALKSGAIFGTSYRKSRNLALSLSDARLQESNVEEFTFKFGQRIKNVYIQFLDFNLDKSKLLNKVINDPNKPAEVVATGPDGLPLKKKKAKKAPKGNDLVLNFDVSYRHDLSANRLLGQGVTVPSRGSNTLRVSPSATYTVNKQMDLRFYVDYNMINPLTTAAFPSTNASGGFVVSFKLQ